MFLNDKSLLDKTDQELVALSLKEKNYYKYIIQKYEDKLRRYIIRISGVKRDDADDILQEVFIKVYRNLNDYDPTLKFSSWIYRISHNETVTFLRKASSKSKTISFEMEPIILNILKADLDIEQDIDKKYLAGNIEKIMNNLDDKYREVIILKYMEDKDYKEISDILKKPTGTIATLLKRAKEQLKKEILKNNSKGNYLFENI